MAVPLVRLLVLGVVRLQGQAHGYAVQRTLAEWHVETWTSVKAGSIYHALKQLAKEGALAVVGPQSSSEGPGRLVYALTDAGEREFFRHLEAALGSFSLEELSAGLAFMQALPRERAIALLGGQRDRARQNGAYLAGLIPQQQEGAPHLRDMLALWSQSLATTAAWSEGLVERLTAGEYRMAGD